MRDSNAGSRIRKADANRRFVREAIEENAASVSQRSQLMIFRVLGLVVLKQKQNRE